MYTLNMITNNQLEYMYKEMRRCWKKESMTRIPNRTEFKGLLVMLGDGGDRSSVDKMLAHFKTAWNEIKPDLESH